MGLEHLAGVRQVEFVAVERLVDVVASALAFASASRGYDG